MTYSYFPALRQGRKIFLMKQSVKNLLNMVLFIVLLFINFSFLSAQTDSLQFIYLANTNAAYENCHCGYNPLGGLDRIGHLVNEIRRKNPQVVFIDGGDFTNSYPFDELNRLTIEIYKHLKPDIMMLADQEFQTGNRKIAPSLSKLPSFLLASNFTFKDLPLKPVKYLSCGKAKIAVLAFLDNSSFWYVKPLPELKFSEQKFKKNFETARSSSDFQIVIFHGEEAGLSEFLHKFPAVDLILMAHDQSQKDKLSARPPIIYAGADGEYVTLFTLRFRHRNFDSIRLTKIPVSLKVPADQKIEKIISDFKKVQKKAN